MTDNYDYNYRQTAETAASAKGSDDSIFDPEDTIKKPVKKPVRNSGNRRKVPGLAARALAFGLIAGTAFYGTTSVLSRTLSSEKVMGTQAKTSGSDDTSQSLLSVSDSGSVSQTTAAADGTVAGVAATALPSLVTISCTTVEEMQSMYDYFGQNGMGGYGDLFGNSGFSFGSSYPSGSASSSVQEVSSAGTGVIIGQNENEILIATNNHVVSGATTLSVGFVDETAVTAEIKGTDPSTDLAVVSVKISDIPQETLNKIAVASIGNSEDLALGEQVVAIGNALGYGQSVTSGIISAFDRNLTLSDDQGGTVESTGLIQTDASINSGNSGGGLFNMKGELIAINEAKSSSSAGSASVDNMGFAIPMAKALPILQSLMNGETVTADTASAAASSAYLGIKCSNISEEISQMYGLPVGVSITEVTENSPADRYGLKKGDVITVFNGQSVTTYEELKAAMNQCSAGDTVTLTVSRSSDGEYSPQQISVTLGEAGNEETSGN